MSSASARRSGYSASISSSSSAARARFCPARPNRSKNSLSVPRRKFAIEVIGAPPAAYAAGRRESERFRLHREGQLLDRAPFAVLEPRDPHPQQPHRPGGLESPEQIQGHRGDMLGGADRRRERPGAGMGREVIEPDLD